MYFYRYHLAEPAYDRDGCRLHRMAIGEKAMAVRKVGKVVIYKYENLKDERVEYVMIDHSILPTTPDDFQIQNPAVMGFCSLSRLANWEAIETMILYVSPNFRRLGVATKLYDAILADGQIVICGESHNPKSRALWLKLIHNPNYTVWVQDMNDLDRTSDIWIDEDGETICNLKLYVDIKMKVRKPKEDIRLVAINPKYCR